MMRGKGGRWQREVVNVVSVVNAVMYVLKRLSAEMKVWSYQVMIKTSSFLLHPVPLSSALQLLMVGVYLLPLISRKLLSNYCTYLSYFHWVLMLEDAGEGYNMSVGHDLV